ncbi:undecaprenyldiphospho-muramoylpentapeptide beta-N-acetylglucosaminyltransferase [Candidatus Albibeggiatoa sp. nov. NOAA]|uniref:undecaprenyldiphospho-muramoylpentapeptide beta-N-acetylglucosaminyltransferase n=1 Tax=Candidatus Albibeggiatoa sp. nov. NOAA TaxID=3162724 RepID=UPI0032F6343D|nr:undecaprenyldiphospho-muramoylpentapeptide beta-N-acetylglucosaminyltransferase [Thiotrichaceae bacterium]
MQTHPTVLMMAGGTGGHIFPALAIAQALQAQNIHVEWLGTPNSMEARLVPQNDISIHFINIKGLRGKSKLSLLLAPFKIIWAIGQAMRVIRRVKPQVVIGMGGFASGPGGIAAWLTGKKLLIHEQNAVAGMTNKVLSRFAKQTLQAFPNTFPVKTQAKTVGNPVRESIAALNQTEINQSQLNILVFGGSLGAKALNELVPQALQQLDNLNITVKHQTGEKQLEEVKNTYANAPFSVDVTAFIHDMADAYQWADLVICRAGALTVTELAHAGVASILIPFPHAVDDHQTANAKYLSEQGAAILIQQREVTTEKLKQMLQTLLSKPEQLQTMGQAARQQANPHTTQDIIQIVQQFL